ncbi:MAG: nucleotidyltransferase family protein [Actinomycetota bacterium]|nr:nucleotidyltransferase family protein [Actinomycetota bacterium]
MTAAPAGLVLAAGAGTRFGQPKAPVDVDGERLVDRAVRCLREGGCQPVVVVLGAWVGDVPGAIVVENPDWADGMGSSMRAGLDAVAATDAGSVLVTLVDLPGLTATAVARVVAAEAPIVIAAYQGERGHPVRLAREHWAEVALTAQGDAGARAFLRGRRDVVLVEVGDVASGYDMDEPAE